MSKLLASLPTYTILLILFNDHSNANTITCTSLEDNCHHTEINCLPNEDCYLTCDGITSCLESTINCPINGDCNILCRGGQSCRYSVINATESTGNFNLTCIDSTDHCRNMKIYGSTKQTMHDYNFDIRCNGKYRACAESEIDCPLYGDCNIKCDTDTSCRWTDIEGPLEGDLTVACDGPKSCFDAIIDGKDAWKLDIYGCIQAESCLDLTVYCPPYSNDTTNCFIQGNDNLGRHNGGGTRIYAVNGWKDVDIDYSGTFLYSRHGGYMYCGETYNKSCIIDNYSWFCAESGHYCNDVDATSNPTIYPTDHPTVSPTSQPTIIPTMNPITYSPTVRLAIGKVSSEPTRTITNNQTINEGVPEIVNESDHSAGSSFDKVLVYILSTVAILSLIIAVIVFVKIKRKGLFFISSSKDDEENESESSNEMDGAATHNPYPNMIHRNNSHSLNIKKLPNNFKRATFSHKIQPGSPIAITDDENEFDDDLEDSNSNSKEQNVDREPSSDEIITAIQQTSAVTQTEGLLKAMIYNASDESKPRSSIDPLDSSTYVHNLDNNRDRNIIRRSRISYSANRKDSYLSAAISDVTSIQHNYNYVGAYNPNSMATDCFNEALVNNSNDDNNNSNPIYSNLNDDNVSIHSSEFIVKSDSNQNMDKTPAPPPRIIKKKIESSKEDEKKDITIRKLKIDLSSMQAVNDNDTRNETDSDSEMYRVMPFEPETPTAPSSGPSVDHV